jgi:endoglucanase
MPQSATAPKHFIANPSRFVLWRGINLSHWHSQSGPWVLKHKYITPDDIRLIQSFGYDHVRLPVDESELWLDDGTVNEQAFTYVEKCLGWCADAGLVVVLDLHILRSHHFNARNNEGAMTLWTDRAAQDTFIRLWQQLSDRFHDYPVNFLAYELMNEPVAPQHEQWNTLINRAVEAVRQREPDRLVVMGSNRWQQPFTFPHLRVPTADPNIILSCHTYHPYFVTHYKAHWSASRFYTGPVHYPGQTITDADFEKYVDKSNEPLMDRLTEERGREHFDKDKLRTIVSQAVDRAAELGLQLYCNEFGCLPSVPRDVRLRYYTDITDVFRENNMAFANWDYKGDFGILRWDRDNQSNTDIDHQLIKVLTR